MKLDNVDKRGKISHKRPQRAEFSWYSPSLCASDGLIAPVSHNLRIRDDVRIDDFVGCIEPGLAMVLVKPVQQDRVR